MTKTDELDMLFFDECPAVTIVEGQVIQPGWEMVPFIEGGKELSISVPKGCRVVRADPSGEAAYLELVVKVKALYQELAVETCIDDAHKNKLVQKVAFAQKLMKMVEDARKAKVAPVNDLKDYLQGIYKRGLIDPLDKGRKMANEAMDAFDEKLRKEQAERDRKIREENERVQAERLKAAAADPDPERVVPPMPPPQPKYRAPVTVHTEAGTRFSKPVLKWSTVDIKAVPSEYTYMCVDMLKVESVLKKRMADGLSVEGVIPGIEAKVEFKGQVR